MNKKTGTYRHPLLPIREMGRICVCLLLIFIWTAFPFAGVSNASAQQLYTPFPSSFTNIRPNELLEGKSLSPFFQKIHSKKTVKVMLIGDSHTKGNYYPHALEAQLKNYFPNLEFAYYGINGAWARRFYEDDMIDKVCNEHPDLVIMSFGTNEAHGGNFDQATHHQTLSTLTGRIKERCKNAVFLLTTPPGSFISQRTGSYTTGRGRRRRTRYTTVKTRNERTESVVQSIVNFGKTHNIAVWDIFNIAGGPTHACINWRDANLMSIDQIHYTAAGYQLQGRLLADATYKAYLSTPARGTQTSMYHEQTPQEQKPYQSVKGF